MTPSHVISLCVIDYTVVLLDCAIVMQVTRLSPTVIPNRHLPVEIFRSGCGLDVCLDRDLYLGDNDIGIWRDSPLPLRHPAVKSFHSDEDRDAYVKLLHKALSLWDAKVKCQFKESV